MLNHNGQVWRIGAGRIDTVFERLFHYRRDNRHRSFPWFLVGCGMSAVCALEGVAVFFSIPGPHESWQLFRLYAELSFFGAIMLVCGTVGLLLERQNHPGHARWLENSYELRLVLPPEIHGDHKLLWKHRREIDEYLLTFTNDNTAEMGITLDWRNEQLIRRENARKLARSILASMNVSADRIEEYFEQQAHDLQLRELRSIDSCMATYADPHSPAGWLAARITGKEPYEELAELREAREQILNRPDGYVYGK